MAANFWASSHCKALCTRDALLATHSADKAKGLSAKQIQQLTVFHIQCEVARSMPSFASDYPAETHGICSIHSNVVTTALSRADICDLARALQLMTRQRYELFSSGRPCQKPSRSSRG